MVKDVRLDMRMILAAAESLLVHATEDKREESNASTFGIGSRRIPWTKVGGDNEGKSEAPERMQIDGESDVDNADDESEEEVPGYRGPRNQHPTITQRQVICMMGRF
jgi:hypothetical protein